jgi:stress response protein SCP2
LSILPGADDKVLDDASMIFSTSRITKTPYCHALSAAVTRIAVTLVIDGSNTVRGLQQLILHCGKYRYAIAPGDRRDKALIVCHVCRHNAQWKLRAVGQGLTEDVIR